jgi:hypothetical protein
MIPIALTTEFVLDAVGDGRWAMSGLDKAFGDRNASIGVGRGRHGDVVRTHGRLITLTLDWSDLGRSDGSGQLSPPWRAGTAASAGSSDLGIGATVVANDGSLSHGLFSAAVGARSAE